jgi:F-type H+-transporting ATPase subunit gamma
MSEGLPSLRRQMKSAGDLRSVVRAMKALAASRISEYEQAVVALADYYRTIELGLQVAIQARPYVAPQPIGRASVQKTHVIVFGTDQGLVGQFNETLVQFVLSELPARKGELLLWVVGARAVELLSAQGFQAQKYFPVPGSVKAITGLVSQLQIETVGASTARVFVFYNRPLKNTLYKPHSQCLLPLNEAWHKDFLDRKWPTNSLPETVGTDTALLTALLREYFFISIYRACAESVASENSSRLAAMKRADKNTGELLQELTTKFNGIRQNKIDEELFEVVSAYEQETNTT